MTCVAFLKYDHTPTQTSGFIVQIALLKTLALVASELLSVPEATLQQCMRVAERLASAYSALWPKQRAAVDAAFVGMLQALSAKQACLL